MGSSLSFPEVDRSGRGLWFPWHQRIQSPHTPPSLVPTRPEGVWSGQVGPAHPSSVRTPCLPLFPRQCRARSRWALIGVEKTVQRECVNHLLSLPPHQTGHSFSPSLPLPPAPLLSLLLPPPLRRLSGLSCTL